MRRRELVKSGLVAAGTLSLGPAFWETAFASPARAAKGPYGALLAPDRNGLMLPEGFRSRVVARGGAVVTGTPYVFPIFPDGAATYGTRDGGWVLVSNSEVPAVGGASAIRFAPDGEIEAAYRILDGTDLNCAGGATPWGTWLSCEETDEGQVWECDPFGTRRARVRPALGTFKHEAVAYDPREDRLYLTEDLRNGALYRFTLERRGDLDRGLLEIAMEPDSRGRTTWKRVPDPSASETPTRFQVPGRRVFERGEGIWYDSGNVYVATTADRRIHVYNTESRKLGTLFRASRLKDSELTSVDNLTVSRAGDIFVCEDHGDPDPLDVALITQEPKREVSRFLRATGSQHKRPVASELTGICFNPAGDRLYVSSQRGNLLGIIYEVSGPFRRRS